MVHHLCSTLGWAGVQRQYVSRMPRLSSPFRLNPILSAGTEYRWPIGPMSLHLDELSSDANHSNKLPLAPSLPGTFLLCVTPMHASDAQCTQVTPSFLSLRHGGPLSEHKRLEHVSNRFWRGQVRTRKHRSINPQQTQGCHSKLQQTRPGAWLGL